MESVEDLMVGEEAEFQLVVGETLMDGMVNGREDDVIATVAEYIAETLVLIRRVAEDKDSVALRDERCERLGYEVEVLVIASNDDAPSGAMPNSIVLSSRNLFSKAA